MDPAALESAVEWAQQYVDPKHWPCCNWVALVLRRAAGVPKSPWRVGGDWWAKVCIWEGQEPMAPVWGYRDLLEALGVDPSSRSLIGSADVVVPFLADPGWYVVQGWRSNGTGHQFLVERLGPDRVWVHDSTENSGPGSQKYSASEFSYHTMKKFIQLGAVRLTPIQEEAQMADENAGIKIPKEVSEEILEDVKAAGRDAVQTALDELASRAADGKVDARDASQVAVAILEELLDGVVAVGDALLPLPEPFESVSDLALDELKGVVLAESGPLEDLGDLIRDVLDGPEVEDIVRKLAKHAYRGRVQGVNASLRKERKHAMRLLRHFPGAAEQLGITGELGTRSSLDLSGYEPYLPEGSDVPALRPVR